MGPDSRVVLCLLITFLGRPAQGNKLVDRAADPVAHLTTLTNRLSHKISSLSSNVAKLESHLAHKQSQLDSDASRLTLNAHTVQTLTSQLTSDSVQMTTLDSFSKTRYGALQTRASALEHSVAFSLQFQNDNVSSMMADHSNLLFDRVLYNVGGGNYSNSTGRYTVPVDGAYAFFLTMQRLNPTEDLCLQVSLMKNNGWTGCTVSACPPGHSSASNTCILHLKREDSVHAVSWSTHLIFGFIHSTLSGFRLI